MIHGADDLRGPSNHRKEGTMWNSFMYQYAVGGFFFFLGIWIGIRKRALKLERRKDRLTLAVLLGGFLLYFCAHGLWMLWALKG